jgi:hypothetical protein
MKEFDEDDNCMMAIQVGGNIYQLNEYLVVKSFKRLLVNNLAITGLSFMEVMTIMVL